jgi:ribosomal protein L37AE/L43A
VFFLFWFGSDVKEERRPAGFFDCPRCGERRPCDVVRLRRTLKLYSVLPVWTSTLSEVRVCQVCEAREGDIPPPAMEAGTWRCPKCRNVNPGGTSACLGCRTNQ